MPINVDQCQSILLNSSECRIVYHMIGIDQHYEVLRGNDQQSAMNGIDSCGELVFSVIH